MIIQQDGENCIVELREETRIITNCSAEKLANTFWELGTDRYTPEEMRKFGFRIRKKKDVEK